MNNWERERNAICLILLNTHDGALRSRITSPDIASRVGCDNRQVRTLISEMRIAAMPFGFDAVGMFSGRSGHPEDLDGTIRSIESRISELFKVRRGLRQARRNLDVAIQRELAL